MCGGGGGGGFDITDPIDWRGAGETLASVDPGPAIGSGLAELDKGVNKAIPGGWITVGALAAGGLALAYAPEVMALAESAGIAPEVASVELGIPPVDAVTGEAVAPDVFAGLSANAPVDTTLSEAAADSLAASGDAGASTGYTGASNVGNLSPAVSGEIGAGTGTGTGTGTEFGLNAAPSTGIGMSAKIPEGVVIGNGLNGGEIGVGYMAGANGEIATDVLGQPILADSVGFGGVPAAEGALSAKNVLDAARLAKTGYNLLTGAGVPKTGASAANLLSRPSGTDSSNISADLAGGPQNITADLTKGNTSFSLNDFGGGALAIPQIFNTVTNPAAYTPIQPTPTQSFKTGGDVESHNPTFFSPGGLASMENTYVKGEGDGTSDSVAAMLANGEFVIPADVVSKLGNGSNDAGANVLDEFLSTIREHAQNHNPKELPPDSKGPLAYLAEANKKARA
jgi:hypothetical protein